MLMLMLQLKCSPDFTNTQLHSLF